MGDQWVVVDQSGTHGPFQTETAAREFANSAAMVPLAADAGEEDADVSLERRGFGAL